jgi:putative ABC transport system permease protein
MLSRADRWLWVCLARICPGWRSSLIIVKPETVVSWHRKAFLLDLEDPSRSARPTSNPEGDFGLRTMNEMLGQAVGPQRYRTYLTAGFAALALLLTVIGIYGVMSFFVSERIKEIGIRMALGAHRNDVVGMVLRRGMSLALAGIAIGLVAAFGATRFITTLLFDVKPTDPATLIGVSILLAAFSFAATYVPARRATRVDPMIALRHE